MSNQENEFMRRLALQRLQAQSATSGHHTSLPIEELLTGFGISYARLETAKVAQLHHFYNALALGLVLRQIQEQGYESVERQTLQSRNHSLTESVLLPALVAASIGNTEAGLLLTSVLREKLRVDSGKEAAESHPDFQRLLRYANDELVLGALHYYYTLNSSPSVVLQEGEQTILLFKRRNTKYQEQGTPFQIDSSSYAEIVSGGKLNGHVTHKVLLNKNERTKTSSHLVVVFRWRGVPEKRIIGFYGGNQIYSGTPIEETKRGLAIEFNQEIEFFDNDPHDDPNKVISRFHQYLLSEFTNTSLGKAIPKPDTDIWW